MELRKFQLISDFILDNKSNLGFIFDPEKNIITIIESMGKPFTEIIVKTKEEIKDEPKKSINEVKTKEVKTNGGKSTSKQSI